MRYIPNQKVKIIPEPNSIIVINDQDTSTPGVYIKYNFTINQEYKIITKLDNIKIKGKLSLWIADANKKTLLFPNSYNDIVYKAKRTDEYLIGVLMSGCKKGDSFILYNIKIIEVVKIKTHVTAKPIINSSDEIIEVIKFKTSVIAKPTLNLSIQSIINSSDEITEKKIAKKSNLYNIVTMVPVHGRHKILSKVLNALKKQSLKTYIVCVTSTKEDYLFCIDQGCIDHVGTVINYPNKPLSTKHQKALNYIKKLKPNAVMICGSDDILTPNWVNECYTQILLGNDIVGKKYHYIWDVLTNTIYKNIYKADFHIGAGKMLSSNILFKVQWHMYSFSRNSSLDYYSNLILQTQNPKNYFLTNQDENIISVKKDWKTITSLNDIQNAKNSVTTIEPMLPIYHSDILAMLGDI